MNKILIDVFLYVFECILFYYYGNNAFNSNMKKSLRFLIVLFGHIVLFFVYQIGINYVNGITIIIVLCLLIRFVYNSNWLTSILHSIFYLATMIAGEYLVYPLANVLFDLKDVDAHNNLHSYLFAVITSKVIHFICIMVMLFFISKNKHEQVKDTKGFALILTVPISNMVILAFIEYISKQLSYDFKANVLWGMIALFMLLTNFLVYYNRNYIIKQAERINELNIENQKKKLDEQYLSIIEKSNDEMKILAHDFQNHLIFVRDLSSAEDKDKYIDKIIPRIDKYSNAGISNNKTLDIIISKYSTLCDINNIGFYVDVKTANLSQVDSFDLVTLLNNLLDNAFESALQSSKKEIQLCICHHSQYFDKLTIANSCENRPAIKDDKLSTWKKDKKVHGYGLKSVKKIAKKYNADYYWEYNEESKTFLTSIIIPKN